MKTFSNTYIFVFSTVMVMLVATLLSFVAEQLKPFQEKNVEIEKKLDILRSVGIARDIDDVKDKNTYVEESYEKNITNSFAINVNGEPIQDVDAFKVNLKAELAKSPEQRNLPVFVYVEEDGTEIYIMVRVYGAPSGVISPLRRIWQPYMVPSLPMPKKHRDWVQRSIRNGTRPNTWERKYLMKPGDSPRSGSLKEAQTRLIHTPWMLFPGVPLPVWHCRR
jgi:hypothetical protein